MIKNLLLLLPLALLLACAAKKSNSQSNKTNFNLDGIEIGKNQTGIIGTLKSIEPKDNGLKIVLIVDSSKQGGASSLAVGKGATTEIIATPIFLRQYQEKNESDLAKSLKSDMKVLAIVTRSAIKQENNLVHISY